MTVGREPSCVIEINGQPYFLHKNPATGQPDWHDREVETQEGDPTVPGRYRFNDWSRGMGDSRGLFKGAVESATNAYLGMIGRLLPGPKVGTIATGHNVAVTAIVEVSAPASRIISFGGQYAKEIDPSAWTVSTTKDFGGGATVTGAQQFRGQTAIGMGDAAQFQRRDASGTYAASTTTNDGAGDYRYATCFGLSPVGDLTRGHGVNWSHCSAADFYGTNANWSADYPIGDDNGKVTQVGNFERWDYVFKEEGLYTFDSTTSKETNVLPDIAAFRNSENKRWFTWFNRLFLCTFAGLYRYLQNGSARTVGIEDSELNEGLLTNAYPTAGVAFGKWAYVAYYDPTAAHTYICALRNAASGDCNFGSPFTLTHVIDDFAGKCNAMIITSAPGTPHVVFARDTSLGYFQLSRDGRPVVWRDSGNTVVTFAPSDLDAAPMTVKYARSVESITRNVAAGRTAQFALSWDGGTFHDVGAALAAPGFNNSYLTLTSNDTGLVPQLRVTLTNNSTATPPEVRDVILNYEQRPKYAQGAAGRIRLRDNDQEGDVSSRLSAYEQKSNLMAILDGPPFQFTDPYGDTYTAAARQYRTAYTLTGSDVDYQLAGEMPQPGILVLVRRLDYGV
jgi:hypothetical protein